MLNDKSAYAAKLRFGSVLHILTERKNELKSDYA